MFSYTDGSCVVDNEVAEKPANDDEDVGIDVSTSFDSCIRPELICFYF